jgi:putative phosphoesterase
MGHYAPGGGKEGLYPWTPQQRLEELAKLVREEVVITGHTHVPFARMAGGKLFINPGSIGRSHTAPTWASLELSDAEAPSAEVRTCPFLQSSI